MSVPRATDYSAVRDDLAHQSPSAICAMFGRVAARYDLMNHVMGGGLDLYWRHAACPRCGCTASPRASSTSPPAAATSSSRSNAAAPTPKAAIGADFCLPMLQRAQAKGARSNLLVGDGTCASPSPTPAFDAVTISWGLRNFADRLAGLREMRRVLRPGGRAYVLEFSHPAALIAPLYFWYLRHVMPHLRAIPHPRARRLRIPRRLHPRLPAPQPALAALMREAGFAAARWTNLTLGIAALHIAGLGLKRPIASHFRFASVQFPI